MCPQRRVTRLSHFTPLDTKVKQKARKIISIMSFLIHNHTFIKYYLLQSVTAEMRSLSTKHQGQLNDSISILGTIQDQELQLYSVQDLYQQKCMSNQNSKRKNIKNT